MRRLSLLLVMLLLGAGGGAAWAQERFTLEGDDWTQEPPVDPATPEGQLQAIRTLIAAGDGKGAVRAAKAWQDRYPNHPRLVEALLLEGDGQVTRGSYYKALFPYEAVIRQYPGTEYFRTALQRELHIAQVFSAGWKRKYLGIAMMPNHSEAEELYIRVQERAPGTEIGEEASILLGDHFFTTGQMRSAAEAYDLFLLNYPNSMRREWAMLRLIQSNLATFKGPQFSATGLIEAAQRIRDYKREFPVAAERIGANALLVRIDESLALKEYHVARWYEQVQKPISAATMYQRLVRDYPQTGAAEMAIDRLRVIGEPIVSSVAAAVPTQPRPASQPDAVRPQPAEQVPSDVDAAMERRRGDDAPRPREEAPVIERETK